MPTAIRHNSEPADEIRKSLSRRSLEYARFGYDSACQDWRDLEAKLRGLAGISGIFIGGIAALAGRAGLGWPDAARFTTLITIGAIIALACAVIFALRGLSVRDYELPRPSRQILEDAIRIIDDGCSEADCVRLRARDWTARAAREYANSEATLGAVNVSKVGDVRRAQGALLIGSILGTAALLFAILGPASSALVDSVQDRGAVDQSARKIERVGEGQLPAVPQPEDR